MSRTASRIRRFFGEKAGVAGGLMIATGLLGLLGMTAATAWADDEPNQAAFSPPAANGLVVQSTSAEQNSFTDRVRGMIQDHMGLTGEEAEAWASQMAEHMREIHGDDAEAVLESCQEYRDGDRSGSGPGSMMDGFDPGTMMDGFDPGTMMDGFDPGTMMDGFDPGSMMGGSGAGTMMDGFDPGTMMDGFDPGSMMGGSGAGGMMGY